MRSCQKRGRMDEPDKQVLGRCAAMSKNLKVRSGGRQTLRDSTRKPSTCNAATRVMGVKSTPLDSRISAGYGHDAHPQSCEAIRGCGFRLGSTLRSSRSTQVHLCKLPPRNPIPHINSTLTAMLEEIPIAVDSPLFLILNIHVFATRCQHLLAHQRA